jgi:pSer/pThr/pTyr-binding forkhead associated (FHA) protein
MRSAAASRSQLASTLRAAYADGLISDRTLSLRLDQLLRARLVEPQRLVGDLDLRESGGALRDRISQTMSTMIGRFSGFFGEAAPQPSTLLALDWTAEPHELVVGRSSNCDIIITDPTVSRRHARLILREGRWILQDLASTNGSHLNGRRVGRCELRPGDELYLGDTRLRVD